MVRRWDIVWVDWGKPVGHEPDKVRPALVVSYDELHLSPYVVVCPFTTNPRRPKSWEVQFPSLGVALPEPSILMVHCIRSISDKRIRGEVITTVREPELRVQVETVLARILPTEAARR